ncbi:MAG: zinc-dependent metalloprotease family protein [Bythopirellula sp.]|nr:zinc-dependent metalloprotease family protein [Bythopirellula sp.]
MATVLSSRAQAARLVLILIGFTELIDSAAAVLIVNPAQPIIHQLEVQIIQTSLNNGTLPATIFGNSSQRADIEAGIDEVWAQAGIDITFLPTITSYANTFAFQGTATPRPSSDLSLILSNARLAGKLNPDPQVVNMFFVEIVPGYAQLSQFTVAGIASINGTGAAVFVGESLLSSATNRDIVASVVAHEIGHNLGLVHTTTGGANLMSPNGTTEQLSTQQIATALQSSLLQEITPGGDFSGDGIVNSADLTIWRNAYGVNANGDANGDGDTDGRDFLQWQKEYGTSGLVASGIIPEPTSATLLIFACGFASKWRPLQRITPHSPAVPPLGPYVCG